MHLREAEALVLDVFDLQERDRIVTFLTAEHGKKKGVAQGARTKFSRFAGHLQLLSKVRIGWREKDGRELVRIQSAETVRPAAALQEDLEGILLTAYLAEHMTEFSMEDDPSSALYRLLDSTIEALLAGVDPDLAARYFEVWTLRLAGVLPVPRECPLCGRPLWHEAADAALLDSEGAVVCLECSEGHRRTRLGPLVLDFLRRSGRENLESLSAQTEESRPPTTAALRAVESLATQVRRHFLQAELKSYRVMRDTLSL